MQSSQQGVVTIERPTAHVAVITLNRPKARNAINADVTQALAGYLKETEGNPEIRAVVLASSHPTVFCAGADLGAISRGEGAALSTSHGGFAGITRAERFKPWIAAVDGVAFAGGFEIVLSCDMIVASEASRFGLPEVKRGLFAAAAGPLRLLRVLPRTIALEMVVTGEALDGERAYALGMANRLAAPGRVLEEAIALASSIADNAPLAVRESLALARVAASMDDETYWAKSEAVRELVFASEDAFEGPRAFLEKREPAWTGR